MAILLKYLNLGNVLERQILRKEPQPFWKKENQILKESELIVLHSLKFFTKVLIEMLTLQ